MADSKASKLRPPSKIGRPCCTVPPKPALPPSPPRSTMNSMDPLWESHGRRLSEAGLRRGSDTSVVLTDDTDSFIIGDRVWVGGTKPGCIAYIGETQFAPGDWAGVVLDEPIGKNDGSVAGSRYFQCEPKRGIFSRLTRLTRQPLAEAMVMSPTGEKTPTSPADTSRFSLNKSMSPSLNASTTSLASVSHKDLKIGDRVIVSSSQGSKTGVLRFVGTTEFAAGEWCGVELDDPVGKNDGSVGEIRYFECRPKHGLFAPLHKVSRSPSSRRTSTMCSIHKPSGASMNSSIRRIGGSRESLASMSSVASTNASVTTRGTTSGSRRPGLRTSTPARSSMQEMLKEKQQEIEMLRKERDFERNRISKAATQANNAEQTVITLKQEYDKYREDMEETVREAQASLAQLLEEKNALKIHLEEEKQKSEDLLFRFEEESVNKDDIQNQSSDQSVINALNQSKLQELEKQLSEERERVIQLEHESTKLFEAEEEIIKLRAELSAALNHEQKDLQDIQNRNLCLEEAKITLEKQMLERNDLIEQYASRIKELESKFAELERENVARKNVESDMHKSSSQIQQSLVEKSVLIEKMTKEHQVDSETFKKEIEHLKQVIENITKESAQEKESLVEEHRKIIAEKETTIKLRTDDLAAETKRYTEMHKSALEKLRADNIQQINELSENFKKQLAEKDMQISSIVNQLEEKSMEIKKLVKDLSELRTIGVGKDEELKKSLEQYQELSEKLKLSEGLNVELRNQIDALRLQNEETYSSFAQEKQKLEESVASLLASSGDSSAQLEKLNEDLKTKEKELSELRNAKAAEIEELKKSFESQIEDKTKYITEISADISQKSLRLSALEKEIVDLNNIIANKDEEIKNLLEKTAELQDAITLSEQTKTNLESELRMYDVNIAELNQKLSRAEEKSSQLTEQKTKLEAEIANVISTSSNSSDQLIQYSEDLRAKEKELDQLREKSFQLENSLSSTAAKLAGTLEELSTSNKLAEKLRVECKGFKNEITGHLKTKDELTSQIHELKAREQKLLETTENKEKLEQDLNSKTNEVSELTDKLAKTEENVANLNEKYQSLERESCEKEKQLNNASACLEKGISSIREEWKKSREETENLTAERSRIEQSMKLLQENYNAEIETKKKLESTVMEKNAEMERLESEIVAIKKEKDEASAAAQASSEKYNETLTKLALLNSSLANTETETTLELSNLREQLSRTQANCEEVTVRLGDRENTVKELKEKLSEYVETLRAKEGENVDLSVDLKDAQTSAQTLKELLDEREKEFTEKLEKRAKENSELEERIKTSESKFIELQNDLEGKMKTLQQNNEELLEKKSQEFESLCKTKETELENIRKAAKDLQNEKEDLQAKIVALNSDLTTKESRCQAVQKEMENLRESSVNTAKNEDLKRESELKGKEAKVSELSKENEDLRVARGSMEKTLQAERERIESLSNLLQEAKLSAATDAQNLEEKLNLERTEVARLKENQNRLERENKQVLDKLSKALEDLKIHSENKKNNQDMESYPINQKIQSAGGDMNQNSDRENEFKKITEENETYKGQIEFLNSVIVDMQRKNETLLCKVEVLEMGVPANEADDYSRSTLDKRMVPPRMFCDICDQFDLHETEDCPRQAQDFSEPEKPKNSPKKPPVDRPYCENCEMFGHDTLNCDDAETF